MKICVINQYKSDNIGDKLIGKTFCEYFSENNINVVLAGFSQTENHLINDSSYTKKRQFYNCVKLLCPAYLKYILKFRKKILKEAQLIDIASCDALIIGGGQLIKHKGVFPYSFRLWSKLAHKNKIPLYIYGIGVDDDLNWRDVIRYGRGVDYACYICCRDEISAYNLKKISTKSVDVYPDVVFSKGHIVNSKNNVEEKYLLVMPYYFESAKKNFKSVSNREDYYRSILLVINKIGINKILLSATTSEDLYECSLYLCYLRKNGINCSISPVYSDDDLINIISGAEAIVSGRMHAMIIASLVGVKSYPLEVSPKIRDFNETILINENIDNVISEARNGLDSLKKRLSNDIGV